MQPVAGTIETERPTMKTKRDQMACERTRRSGLLSLTAASLLLAASTLSGATHYVSLGSTNPVPPYTNWATAATNIQDAVDAATSGDTVLVNDGVYAQGQKAATIIIYSPMFSDMYTSTYRVAVTSPIALRSVNGPQFTLIGGGGAMRCVLLVNGASLTGFTLTNCCTTPSRTRNYRPGRSRSPSKTSRVRPPMPRFPGTSSTSASRCTALDVTQRHSVCSWPRSKVILPRSLTTASTSGAVVSGQCCFSSRVNRNLPAGFLPRLERRSRLCLRT